MKLLLTLFFTLSIYTYNWSQLNICLGNDTTLCSSQAINVQLCPTTSNSSAIILNSPSTLTLSDDVWSAVVNLGFSFSFYGNTYTQCIVGSNGLISFELSKANGYCEYSFTGVSPLPNPTLGSSLNSVMMAYQDLNPGISGAIRYKTIGTAPNRQFVVLFDGINGFSCDATSCSYTSLILNETSNRIELHVGTKGICSAWNGGLSIQGIQNQNGTNAVIVPGRNITAWTTNQDGQIFIPTTPTNTSNYTNNPIPYKFVGTIGTINTAYLWADTDGNTFPYTPGVSLNIPNPAVGSTGYYLAAGSCGNAVGAITDTTTITVLGSNLLTDSTQVSCAGGNDGTASVITSGVNTYTYLWNDAANQSTATATGLQAGAYTCTVTNNFGCVEVVNVTVTEKPALIVTIPLITDVSCNSANNGVIQVNATQGTAPYTYFWAQSASTTNMANDLFAGLNTVTITDANGCFIDTTILLNEPSPLSITMLTPDTVICPENNIMLHVSGTGGSSPYIFVWTENGNPIGLGDSILVDPSNPMTTYCVTLSEQCGSPFVDSCLILTFPTVITPNLSVDKTEACVPGLFEFQNTSSNASEIQTTLFNFFDNNTLTEIGNDSTSHTFNSVQSWNIGMTITSIYGCVYDSIFTNVMMTNPLPIPQFGMSSNPTSIFETTIMMQEHSLGNIVNWFWNSPFSNPPVSTSENPLFSFPEGVEGNYPITLYTTTEKGCVDSITHILSVNSDIIFYAPNAFTPNGDQFNNHWIFYTAGIDIYNFELSIYNRWGQLIFVTKDTTSGWDGTFQGKLVQTDIYTWRATVKDLFTDKKVTFNGSINVMR